MEEVKGLDVQIVQRRMERTDLEGLTPKIEKWYICTGTKQRSIILEWLDGQEVVYEDYNF
jgi:hypothetical protein